jgi:hypothetical protein
MKLTKRQAMLLANMDRLVLRKKMSGKIGIYLDHDDCSSTINSLIVKGALKRLGNGELQRCEPELRNPTTDRRRGQQRFGRVGPLT